MDADKQAKGRTTRIELANQKAFKVPATIIGLENGGLSLRGVAGELNKMNAGTCSAVTRNKYAIWLALK
jgi:hypothetical protein